MRREVLWILIFLFLILSGVLIFELVRSFTGRAILDDYVYTRAICNVESCRDYEVVCDGKRLVEVREIDGEVVGIGEDWKDFREAEIC